MSDEQPDHIAITKVRLTSLGGLASSMTVKDHEPIVADEPLDFVAGQLAGGDTGWTPVQYQLAALISCAAAFPAMTLVYTKWARKRASAASRTPVPAAKAR